MLLARRVISGSAFLLLFEFLVAAEQCFTEGEVRLEDGLTQNEGRVEICLNGEWGTICDHQWGASEARIVCQQLGLPAEYADAIYRHGGGSGPIHYAGFTCNGMESQLSLCPVQQRNSSIRQITNCQHLEDAGVRCTNVPCVENAVRLNEEVVQVCHDQQWGLMCAPRGSWDQNAVQILCTQVGKPSELPRSPSRRQVFYDAPVIWSDVTCNGTEASIVDCTRTDNGSFTDCSTIAVAQCEAQESCSGTNGIRLTRFSSDTMGRLEVCADGMWGSVCGNAATIDLVRVACRQLNHAPGGTLFTENNFAFLLDGLVPIRRTNVMCAGNENSLSECSFDGAEGDPTCTHRDDVIIMCATQAECNEGDVRLVDGQTSTDGRVEVCLDGFWGSVCDNRWDSRDAAVVCRQLKFNGPSYPLLSFGTRGQSSVIHLDDVHCIGTEERITECSHSGIGVHTCIGGTEEAGVICTNTTCEDGAVHLVGGDDVSRGRVEYCYQGTWYSVCANSWDESGLEAGVICRTLGYQLASAVVNYGRGYSPILPFSINCSIGDSDFDDCAKTPLDAGLCPYVAGVDCEAICLTVGLTDCEMCGARNRCAIVRISDGSPVCNCYSDCYDYGDCCADISNLDNCSISECETGAVRLVGGATLSTGRLEVCANGLWGRVCNRLQYWGPDNVRVVCRQLGFPTEDAQVVEGELARMFGVSERAPLLGEVHCIGTETELLECSHTSIGRHSCGINVVPPVPDIVISCVEVCQPPCVNGLCNPSTGDCDCSPGYTGISCNEDIRECEADNGGCDHNCIEFPGGYNCSCRAGYNLLQSDGTSCIDIDECEEGNRGCSQICVNTPGSYFCNCQRGFQLFNNTHCEDVNECEVLSPNGFCSQVCVNTIGSFHCECREGYKLFRSFLCIDVDECSKGIDSCSNSELTPARCINTEGSYRCTCDEHVGYRLASNGTTCEDVDECREQEDLCTEGTGECANTPGSYSCSCTEGYEVKVDQNSCTDIDECSIMNGGCQHSCTNTFGSFKCSCNQGYRLLDDGSNCEALSCDPVLEAPPNGSMECDRQTVGGTCRFTCHEGYTLTGSGNRTCLPSLQWRGPPATCHPPLCPLLTPPDDGFVLFPCTREEGRVCHVVCAHGYRLEGPSNRTCRKDKTGSLVWSDGPQCVEGSPCSSDPCLNGGLCIKEGTEFRCVCNGTATGYSGLTCEIRVVYFRPIPPVLDDELKFPITFYTDVVGFSKIVRVSIKVPNVTGLQKARVRVVGGQSSSFDVNGRIGVVKVTLPRNAADVIYKPRERDIYVTGGTINSGRQSYFEQFNLTRGLLRPSCCSADDHVTLSCPGDSTQTISLLSPCGWSIKPNGVIRTENGAVFVQSSRLTLPTSLSGLRYRGSRLNDIIVNPKKCNPCNECNTGSDRCSCYNHTTQDTLEFLQARALAFTYISQIQSLLPDWVQLHIDLQTSLELSGTTKNDLFAPITRPSEPVSSLEGCEKLTNLKVSRYSVLRYDKTLSAVINGERYDYTETGTMAGDDVLCVAVDMCHESESPVHMQISQPINDILVHQYLSQFTQRGWSILFNTVSLFKQPVMTLNSNTTFWNGLEMVSLPDINPDISVNTEHELEFTKGDLNFRVEFNGDALLEYRKRQGTLKGQITLVATKMIDGTEQGFKLSSYDRTTNAYFHIEDVVDPCQSRIGLSFAASYQEQPGELFFTRLLRFNETTQSCSFSAFLPLTGDYRALGLSLHTECPLLAIGELILPEMSHTITFIGSQSPNCFTSNFLGLSDLALVIESEMVNHRLPLGNIFELQANSGGPDVVTVFERGEGSGPVSLFHSVQVTLFGGVFQSEATVRNHQLTISTSSSGASVFGYPAQMTITAPSNNTNWQDLELTVDGSLLPGNGSFIENLSRVVTRKLQNLARSANLRREVAQMSLDQSTKRLLAIEVQYNQTVSNLSLAIQRKDAASESIEEATRNLRERYNSSQNEGQVDLERVCTLESCRDECMPGQVCRSCFMPTFIKKTSKCPITVKELRTVRVAPFFVFTTTWRFVLECRQEMNGVCTSSNCAVDGEEVCYGKCVPVQTLVPVYNLVLKEVEIPSFENCTVSFFNSSVPGRCCENVTCAERVPESSCVTSNVMCRKKRQNATEGMAQQDRELLRELLDAQRDLSLAEIAARRADVDVKIYEQRRDQLGTSLERFRRAQNNSLRVYERTLEDVEPLLRIYESGNGSGYMNIFDINSVTFSTKFTNNPTSLVFNVVFHNLISGTKYRESYLYISTQSEAVNLERMADDIIDTAFIGDSKRSMWLQTRLRRQTKDDLTPRQIFASRCAQVSNTQLFLAEIQARLAEIQENIDSSSQGAGELSQRLSEEGPQEDEEFAAYLDLIRDYEDLSTEALRALESTIFSEWQAGMELLYSESGSVGEVGCDGLADCLLTSSNTLQNLIDLTPESQLSREFISLRLSFPLAVTKLLELALLSNITIQEGLARVEPIIEITTAYATNNYWCNEPPIMMTEPPPEMNISLGATLQLSCTAESNLPVTYYWMRDGNVLPQFTTNKLVIPGVQRQDSANYTCVASNPVGTAVSINTSVTVYELPQFYLLPESVVTYFGDGNGAWFACNASAWPYPGWRWYHHSSPDTDWRLIEGEQTNELLVVDPQEEDEGMYACEAFNYHGSIRSEPVTLTLLPFTVSQHQFPLEFSVFTPNRSCTGEDLYNSLYSLLSDTITGETSTIEDFNVTEVDSEDYDVSLSLVSRNITTPYLHFSTFADIANSALPHASSLRKSVQLITDLLNGVTGGLICPGTGSSVVEDSLVVGKLRYVCPGQRLHSDYLLCLSCEKGHYSSETERSRIVNGVSYSETVPVCERCPLDTYADALGSTSCSQCPNYHTTSTTEASSLSECLPQPLVLVCEASTTSGHIDIDCKTNRPPQITLCSFNGGPKHQCSYPVAINRDVSPLGSHRLTIFVEDDEGFQAETTIPYFLQEDSKPTAPAVVPPLEVRFIQDTPRVQGDSVEAHILLSRPVTSLVCRLKGGSYRSEKNCSSGHVMFSGLSPALYTLRVVATNRRPDKEFIKTRFEITDDVERCTLHLINGGVVVSGDSATVEFTGRGPAAGYLCHLDKTQPYICSSPVVRSGLSRGRHVLKVVPTGCGRNRMNLKTDFTIQ